MPRVATEGSDSPGRIHLIASGRPGGFFMNAHRVHVISPSQIHTYRAIISGGRDQISSPSPSSPAFSRGGGAVSTRRGIINITLEDVKIPTFPIRVYLSAVHCLSFRCGCAVIEETALEESERIAHGHARLKDARGEMLISRRECAHCRKVRVTWADPRKGTEAEKPGWSAHERNRAMKRHVPYGAR